MVLTWPPFTAQSSVLWLLLAAHVWGSCSPHRSLAPSSANSTETMLRKLERPSGWKRMRRKATRRNGGHPRTGRQTCHGQGNGTDSSFHEHGTAAGGAAGDSPKGGDSGSAEDDGTVEDISALGSKFASIYQTGLWGKDEAGEGTSGGSSLPEQTVGYRGYHGYHGRSPSLPPPCVPHCHAHAPCCVDSSPAKSITRQVSREVARAAGAYVLTYVGITAIYGLCLISILTPEIARRIRGQPSMTYMPEQQQDSEKMMTDVDEPSFYCGQQKYADAPFPSPSLPPLQQVASVSRAGMCV
mmetsp:Transcript_14203/g.33813  ORF Transcript_14203/g.33813 Transcript_14203/m.33813 type:complete len:298 (+) Transcript_14203:153-1046(+)